MSTRAPRNPNPNPNPNQALLHPTAAVDALAAVLPSGFAAPLAIIRNWTYALFYTMAELWGSVVVSLLFWGFANEVTKVEEAKKYYPLFGLGANVALIFSGQYVRFVSSLRRAAQATASAAVDPWQTSLNWLMGTLVRARARARARANPNPSPNPNLTPNPDPDPDPAPKQAPGGRLQGKFDLALALSAFDHDGLGRHG